MLYIFLIVILLMPASPANAGIIDTTKEIIDTAKEAVETMDFIYTMFTIKTWNNDWRVADYEGKPVKRWKHSTHIHAWIDITGFRNESLINGTRYVDGEAEDFAIVKRYATYRMGSGERATSFRTYVSVSDSNNKTTATQKSTLNYEIKDCSPDGCDWISKTETQTTEYTAESPENFTPRIPNVTAHVKTYKRNVAPVTQIYVSPEAHPWMKDVMIVNVTYNGSSVCRHDQVGTVNTNDRRAEHVNFTDYGWKPSWRKSPNQTEIDHCGQMVTVYDQNFNLSLLNISLHTPYETKYIENIVYEKELDTLELGLAFFKVMLVLVGSVFTLVTIWKVAKRCA